MKITKQYSIIYLIIMLIVVCCIPSCGNDERVEISNKKDVISCKYIGLSERDGQPIVDLVFRNNSGKNLKALYGGLRIINKNGDVVQRTGFTYSLPFMANEEKYIPAFAYIAIKDEALKILSSTTDFVPLAFELSEIVFEDGQSVKY